MTDLQKKLPGCVDCPRLAAHLSAVRKEHPTYYARPVLPFGAARPALLIVGLAPGMHGANRTGRPFTGDFAGILLYETLHRFGWSNQPEGIDPDDGLRLKDCRITNAVKCLPPENKPLPAEVRVCNQYLQGEIASMPPGSAVLALGSIAHRSVLMSVGARQADFAFGHAAHHMLPGDVHLFDSYHCSRYNTQTRRLTPQMFYDVFENIARTLKR